MVNVGKFEDLTERPAATKAKYADNIQFTHVIAFVFGKWLRFDTFEIAKRVVPPEEHHRIYTDPSMMAAKLGAKKMVEIGREFGCKSTPELWAKLHLRAYDPAVKYEELHEAERIQKRVTVKRYKKKIAYKMKFDPTNDGHMTIYSRLPPQACALLDIVYKITQSPEQQAKGELANVFTEVELQGLINLMKDDLKTRQDPWRIFQYYRGRLINVGFLRFHHDK
jgi:hypothetical protein